MLSKLPQIAKVGIELASMQANKKAGRNQPILILIGQRTEEKQRKRKIGKDFQARCPVTDADSKHSIDQTPMLGKSILSFSYLEMEKDFKQVARGTSPLFLNQPSRTTSWSGSHAMYFTPVQRNMYTGAKAQTYKRHSLYYIYDFCRCLKPLKRFNGHDRLKITAISRIGFEPINLRYL